MAQEDVFKKVVAHCKEYGFVFPSSDIYDGLGAVYDYGQMGVELKNNIKTYWWQSMVKKFPLKRVLFPRISIVTSDTCSLPSRLHENTKDEAPLLVA